jgi:hypothetical protein
MHASKIDIALPVQAAPEEPYGLSLGEGADIDELCSISL